MANTNCLDGIACPQCGQEDEFRIYASSWFAFTDDGTSEFGDVDFDDTTPIRCMDCGHNGTVQQFTKEKADAR